MRGMEHGGRLAGTGVRALGVHARHSGLVRVGRGRARRCASAVRSGRAMPGTAGQGDGLTVFGGVRLPTVHARQRGKVWRGAAGQCQARRGWAWTVRVAGSHRGSRPRHPRAAWQCWARQGGLWFGMPGHGRGKGGRVAHIQVRVLDVRARSGGATLGDVWPGEAGRGASGRLAAIGVQGPDAHAGLGSARQCSAWQGSAVLGMAGCDRERRTGGTLLGSSPRRPRMARPGRAGQCVARQGRRTDGIPAGSSPARPRGASHGCARHGEAQRGPVRLAPVRHGMAR